MNTFRRWWFIPYRILEVSYAAGKAFFPQRTLTMNWAIPKKESTWLP